MGENVKTLNLAITAEVKGMDPINANDRYSVDEISRVYEGLLEYHYLKRPYTLVPNLAESMPKASPDGKTYTFRILKGVYFHDDKVFPGGKGRELVASDFVYSLKRLADPKLQSNGWWPFDGKIVGLNEWRDKYSSRNQVNYDEEVEGLKALDKYTLQFKLAKPYPQFLYALAMPFSFVVAREAVEGYGENFLNHPVGTGPFVLPQFTQSNKIIYTKNPKFRKKLFPSAASQDIAEQGFLKDAGRPLPLVDRVVVYIIKESQTRWLNFLKGKVDFIGIPKDNFESAITPDRKLTEDLKTKGIELLMTPSLNTSYFAFNHDLELFQNVDLRRAMLLAYNAEESNRLFYNNTAILAQSVVPPNIAGYDENYKNPYRGVDLNRAKALLEKAGYPGGKGLPTITLDCFNSPIARQQGEFFKRQMVHLGIDIKVQTNPWPILQDKIKKRKVMAYKISWSADYPDAENFLQLLYGPNRSPGANGSGYNNPKFNELFKKAAIMAPGPARARLYKKLNTFIAEQVPWIFGVHPRAFTLKHSWLKNFIPSDFGSGQDQYLDVDLSKRRQMLNKL